MSDLTPAQIDDWVNRYLIAWRSSAASDIAAVFAQDAEAHELPYETHCDGLDEIVEMWQERATWDGTADWTFDWQSVAVNGDTFVVTGVGHYATLGDFANLWVVTLDAEGKATMFRMWNNEVA